VTDDTAMDMRSYKKIDDHTMDLTASKDGKAVRSGRIVVSKDGTSRTITVSGITSEGKKYKNVGVYDKQ